MSASPLFGSIPRVDSFASVSQRQRSGSGSGSGSYGSLGACSMNMWAGEHAPTQFLDANLNAFEEGKHRRNNNDHDHDHDPVDQQSLGARSNDTCSLSVSASASDSDGSRYRRHRSIMAPLSSPSYNTIRFQVLVWSIGCPCVKTGKVSMKFRVTLFWNDAPPPPGQAQELVGEKKQGIDSDIHVVPNGPYVNANANANANVNANAGTKSTGTSAKEAKKGPSIWIMSGRRNAYEKNLSSTTSKTIDIPPVSILNADSFETIGHPEVTLMKKETRLMRWSCMYRSQLHQEDMTVKEFPHDSHSLRIKLGILSQRQPGGLWDRNKWKIAMANEGDTQRSIKVPHGLLVDHVRIPEFHYNKEAGLDFDLVPLIHGSFANPATDTRFPRRKQGTTTGADTDTDYYLQTSLKVSRDSGYYDKNIMPLLGMLNLVAISILCLDATNFFQRGLLALNIAFLEIGLRMTLDSKLPNVGYIIKMQKVLNGFFFSILCQMLESAALNYLLEYGYCSLVMTRHVDLVVVILLIINQVYLTCYYMKRDDLFFL